MAKQLVTALDKPYEPDLYKDEYQQRLKQLIADKIAGKEIVTPAAEQQSNVIDLMDALKKSIEEAGGKKPRRRKTS